MILEVGNRPVIALIGDLPLVLRDLGRKRHLGDDVRLTEEALGRLGGFTRRLTTPGTPTHLRRPRPPLYTDRKFRT
ncbi:MAG: hypothetical protein IPN02_09985 [Candidatus Microthrix sp.]|uniref:Uncharacterized protein n=1 Tax=Candidatus Neomicrothrix subdominans TaxID=2954438 RepID=A0A936NBX6_9ACTN|nr:hypothetical protein [Candidatus Microthrix subdominans]